MVLLCFSYCANLIIFIFIHLNWIRPYLFLYLFQTSKQYMARTCRAVQLKIQTKTPAYCCYTPQLSAASFTDRNRPSISRRLGRTGPEDHSHSRFKNCFQSILNTLFHLRTIYQINL